MSLSQQQNHKKTSFSVLIVEFEQLFATLFLLKISAEIIRSRLY